jgi:hypothetical protein
VIEEINKVWPLWFEPDDSDLIICLNRMIPRPEGAFICRPKYSGQRSGSIWR